MDDSMMLDVVHGTMEAEGICDIKTVRFSKNGLNVWFKERVVYVPRPLRGTMAECEEIGETMAAFLKPSTHPDLNEKVAEIWNDWSKGTELLLSLKSTRGRTMTAWGAEKRIVVWANGYNGRPDEFFLLSLCHELGHVVAWQRDRVQGHGKEFKWRYAQIAMAALDMNLFSDPDEIRTHISTAPRFAITIRRSEL